MTTSVQTRNLDLSIGYASLGLFGVSIAVLIWFLVALVDAPEPAVSFVRREIERATDGRGDASATFDTLLMLSWGFLHSLMTRPRFKSHLQKVLRPHLELAFYAGIASASLIGVCLLYRPIPREVYVLEGGAALVVRLLFFAGWALFLFAFVHLDVLEVVGLRPILRYVDGVGKALDPFRPGGPFLWVRHPVELAFLVAFWAAPRMTVGHLLFAIVMTLYTFLGVDHEDRRMLELHGTGYAEYIKKVPQILPLPR
jgi:hypothetical protein